MKIMFDTNVLLDVFQNRQAHYWASAHCLNKVLRSEVTVYVPAHALVTFHYVMKKHRGEKTARDAVRWLLEHFQVAPCDHAILERACGCGMADFEDAVVAVAAEYAGCFRIVSHNLGDFVDSPIPAWSPTEFLEQFAP